MNYSSYYPYTPKSNEDQPELTAKITIANLSTERKLRDIQIPQPKKSSDIWEYNQTTQSHEDLLLENNASKSAPPIVEKFTSQSFSNLPETNEFNRKTYYSDIPSKATVSRSNIVTHRPLTEINVENRLTPEIKKREKTEVKRDLSSTEGLFHLPPVRRDPRINTEIGNFFLLRPTILYFKLYVAKELTAKQNQRFKVTLVERRL